MQQYEQAKARFLEKLMAAPEVKRLLSDEHLSAPNRCSIDPDALLCRKFKAYPALPSYGGVEHVLMDDRHALIVDCRVTQATPTRTTTPRALTLRCVTSR